MEVGATLDTAIYNGLMLAYARDAATVADDGIEQVRQGEREGGWEGRGNLV